MAQLIQSIYLVVVITLLSILLSGIEMITFSNGQSFSEFSVFGLYSGTVGSEPTHPDMAFPFYILDIKLVVMHAFVLFPHKKIKVKLKWAQYSFLIYVLSGLGLLIFMLTGSELALQGSAVSPKAGLFLFLAGIPLSYLAVKSVKKDKALVDSVDRIR